MVFETLRNNPDARFHLLVENEMQVEQAERLVAGIEAERCEWVPVFNGENLKFFEDNVFLDEDDITSGPVSMREIFCHQKLNTNYFGTLHFFADGEVKADVNAETVGRFPDKSVLWTGVRGTDPQHGLEKNKERREVFRMLLPFPLSVAGQLRNGDRQGESVQDKIHCRH
jgi:hypothetical protein